MPKRIKDSDVLCRLEDLDRHEKRLDDDISEKMSYKVHDI